MIDENEISRDELVLPKSAWEILVSGGAFESADRFNREVALWEAPGGSADQDVLYDKEELDHRGRDLYRNDAYVHSGVTLKQDNIVGQTYMLNSKPDYTTLRLDEVWATEFQAEVESKFMLYAESLGNWPDASRHKNFTGIIRMSVGLKLLAGEVLAVADWITDDPTRPYSTAIQMVDTDRLSHPPGIIVSVRDRAGVKKNSRGEAVGYYIRRGHPFDSDGILINDWDFIPTRTPWGRQRVIHIFEQYRPDQSRGVAAMASALKETRIAQKFRDVMLQNAIVNASYAATIESELPSAVVFEALGAGKGEDEIAAMLRKYSAGYYSAIRKYADHSKNTSLNGVRIPHLMPGTKLNIKNPGQGGPLGTDFEKSLLRYLAANLNVSYEQLSRDYSGLNYSGLKGVINEIRKGMVTEKKMTADTMATHIFWLWLEEAMVRGEITSMPRNAPGFWEGLNREAYGRCEWIGASSGQVDELKETQAAVLRIRSGLSTREDELGKMGKDWRRVLVQMAREQAEAQRLGLNIDQQDNGMNAVTGGSTGAREQSNESDV